MWLESNERRDGECGPKKPFAHRRWRSSDQAVELVLISSPQIQIMLKFTTRDVGGVLVIAFEATDDLASDWQSSQREWLYKLIESNADPRFAIDLTEVNYLASSEIGFLVTIKRRIDRRKGKVVIFGLSPYIRDIFETMNLVKILDIVDDLGSALGKLGSAPAT
jgi:anti-sigma B factor antagonist